MLNFFIPLRLQMCYAVTLRRYGLRYSMLTVSIHKKVKNKEIFQLGI